MTNGIKNLTNVGKELWWQRVTLPRSCFNITEDLLCETEYWYFKEEIYNWLAREIDRSRYEIIQENVYDSEDSFLSGNRVTAICFKREEDAVLFATVWF